MGAALRPSRFGDGGRPSIGVRWWLYCTVMAPAIRLRTALCQRYRTYRVTAL